MPSCRCEVAVDACQEKDETCDSFARWAVSECAGMLRQLLQHVIKLGLQEVLLLACDASEYRLCCHCMHTPSCSFSAVYVVQCAHIAVVQLCMQAGALEGG